MNARELRIGEKTLLLLHDEALTPLLRIDPRPGLGGGLEVLLSGDEERLLIESSDRCVHLHGRRRRTYANREVFLFHGARVALVDPSEGAQLLFAAEPGLLLGRMRLGASEWFRFCRADRSLPRPSLARFLLLPLLLVFGGAGLWKVRKDAVALAPDLPAEERFAASLQTTWLNEMRDWERDASPPEAEDLPQDPVPLVASKGREPTLPAFANPVGLRGRGAHADAQRKTACPEDPLARQFMPACTARGLR